MKFKVIAIVLLAGLLLVFIFQNVTVATIRLMFWTLSISHSLLMILIFAAGVLVGWMLHNYSIKKKQKAADY